MTEQSSTLLDDLDATFVGVAPVGHLVSGGRAAKRRKHRMTLLLATAAAVTVVGGTAAFIQGFGPPGTLSPSPSDSDRSSLRVEVQDGTAPSSTVDFQAIGGPVAFWEPRNGEVTYVSGNEFSSSCTLTAEATLTATGTIALRTAYNEADCIADGDAVRVAFLVSGLTARPDTIRVIRADGTTRTVHVATPTGPKADN